VVYVLFQVTVLGAVYGEWGISTFGLAPVSLEALDFYPQVLQHQWEGVEQQQQEARRRTPQPAAFVTFK
jgi:hypothetical protein